MDQKARKYLYTAHFRKALEVREQPRMFIDLVARSLGSKGIRLKKWASSMDDVQLKQKIDALLNENGGCNDEWQFLFTACGNSQGAESSVNSNACSGQDTDDDSDVLGNSDSEEIPQPVALQLVGQKVNELHDKLVKIITSTILSGGRQFMVLRGEGMTGKTTLVMKLRESLEEAGVVVFDYRTMSSAATPISLSSNGLVYLDDADLEGMNTASEFEFIKFFRNRKFCMLFICRNSSRFSNLIPACDAKVFDMPEYSDDEMIEILCSMVTKGYAITEPTGRRIFSLMNAYGIGSQLSNGIDIMRMLLFPKIQNDYRLGVEHTNVDDIDFSQKEIEEAVHITIGPKIGIRSSLNVISSDIENSIKRRIIGQDEVLSEILPTLTSIAAGLTDIERPSGVFLFYGPSGVGKTELGRVIADVMFDGAFHKEDMNTYSEKHSVSRITGAPPGYIGYGDTPKIMDFIDSTPRGVLLLDEIEKAHETVMEHIMELLGTGMLADTKGRRHDARGMLIIMTSNITWNKQGGGTIGFSSGRKQKGTRVSNREEVENTKVFKQEILNRIQVISKFSELRKKHLKEIAALLLNELEGRLYAVGIEKDPSSAKRYIPDIVKSYDSSIGARGMKNYTETVVKNDMIERYMEGNNGSNS